MFFLDNLLDLFFLFIYLDELFVLDIDLVPNQLILGFPSLSLSHKRP